MTAIAWIFTMAGLGIAETAYLIEKRKIAEKPVCPIGGDCNKVLASKFNRIFGFIHNDQLGLIFYLSVALLTGLLEVGVGPMDFLLQLLQLLVAGGTLMSLIFVFLMWRIIKAWCFWCLMSATTIFVMALILVFEGANLLG